MQGKFVFALASLLVLSAIGSSSGCGICGPWDSFENKISRLREPVDWLIKHFDNPATESRDYRRTPILEPESRRYAEARMLRRQSQDPNVCPCCGGWGTLPRSQYFRENSGLYQRRFDYPSRRTNRYYDY